MIRYISIRNNYLSALFFLVLSSVCHLSFATLRCETLSMNGADDWYPYFSHHQLNKFGIIGDVVFQAADRAGLNITLNASKPWKRILFDLGNGDLDIIAGVLKTQQRQKQFFYSSAIHYAELKIFVRKGFSFPYQQISDLVGRRGGKLRGMSLGQIADDYAFDNLVIDDVPNVYSLLLMLANGRLDYGIFYGLTGQQEINKNKLSTAITILPKAVTKEGLHIAYSKKSPCQQEFILLNNEIQKMETDGSIERVIQSYRSIEFFSGRNK